MNQPAFDTELQRETAFTDAWRVAIRLSGKPDLFYGDLDRSRDKAQLVPRITDIRRRIGNLPQHQAYWIALLVQFYQPAEGARLTAKVGAAGLGVQVPLLSDQQVAVLRDLIAAYRVW